ncbi:hypothetical protein [Celeribacter sp.]|uniref:hypothetical protein n=1 Tax=Celeribacter sp. TaxID=1890673 RepID=UPI003A938815
MRQLPLFPPQYIAPHRAREGVRGVWRLSVVFGMAGDRDLCTERVQTGAEQGRIAAQTRSTPPKCAKRRLYITHMLEGRTQGR